MLKHGSSADRENAAREITSIKQNLSESELNNILGTSILEHQSTSAVDVRPTKRRKVRLIILAFLPADLRMGGHYP